MSLVDIVTLILPLEILLQNDLNDEVIVSQWCKNGKVNILGQFLVGFDAE